MPVGRIGPLGATADFHHGLRPGALVAPAAGVLYVTFMNYTVIKTDGTASG